MRSGLRTIRQRRNERLGTRYRLNRDSLAIFTGRATATGDVATPSAGSAVEAVLEFRARLGFPSFYWHPVLLLNPVSVPFWDYVEGAEWNFSQGRREVVDVAALKPLLALVVSLIIGPWWSFRRHTY